MNKEQQAFIQGFQLGLRDAAKALDALIVAPESWTVNGDGHTTTFTSLMQVTKEQLRGAFLRKADDATGAAMAWEATQGGNE